MKKIPAGKVRAYKTAVFKLHNPSQRKKAMLRNSMKHAHLAYGRLLERHMPDAAEVQRLAALASGSRDPTKRQELRAWLSTLGVEMRKTLKQKRDVPLAAKSAVEQEAIAQIKSTIGLQDVQEAVGWPIVTPINDSLADDEQALEQIRGSTELEDENSARDILTRVSRAGQFRPLGFPRSGHAAGFLLLRHPDTGRLYAYLNLMPKHSRFARPVQITDMMNMKTGELVTFRSKTGALFPLAFGHAFHDEGFLATAEPQTARLVHDTDTDEYTLHVAFSFLADKVKTTCWLGVDRGIYKLVAFSVVDNNGHEIERGHFDGRDLRHVQRQLERRVKREQQRGRIVRDRKRFAHAELAVHGAANAIVEAAAKHGAQVVIEELSQLDAIRRRKRIPGRRRSNFNRLLGRRQFGGVEQVLKYKLAVKGLPPPVTVRAAFTSQTCPECGHVSPQNRPKTPLADGFSTEDFKCVGCGYEADADENAARVIGIKRRWYETWFRGKVAKGSRLPDELKFEAYLKEQARRRQG